MNLYETKTVTIETAIFPESAKREFISFVKVCCPRANPYVESERFRHILARKMRGCLIAALQCRAERASAAHVLRLINGLRWHSSSSPSVFMLKNFPVDSIDTLIAPPTDPSDYSTFPPEKTGKLEYLTEWSLDALAQLADLSVIQTREVQNNNRFQRLVPQKGKESIRSGIGAEFFGLHTEATYRADNAMVGFLAALRNRRTPTLIATLPEIERVFRDRLTAQELALLELPIFRFKSGATFSFGSKECVRPMFLRDVCGQLVEMQLNGNLDKVEADPAEAEKRNCPRSAASALVEKVAHVLQDLNQGIVLSHGELLVFENLKVVHSRTALAEEDRLPGEERHLIRVTARRPWLRNAQHMPSDWREANCPFDDGGAHLAGYSVQYSANPGTSSGCVRPLGENAPGILCGQSGGVFRDGTQ